MKTLFRWMFRLLIFGLVCLALGLAGVYGLYKHLEPELPDVAELKNIQLQVPLRVYDSDGRLISEFGDKRRTPLNIADVPPLLKQAFIAAEDDRFYEHPGVDYQGLLRAAIEYARTGQRRQGGSTITMQAVRNYWLSAEKTWTRKIKEIFLSFQVEQMFSKEEVLELYFNVIYLGNRAYGVGSAAEVYYGKGLNDLTLAQMAMIAGLPKAPSKYNPIVNEKRALERRAYVLRRMRELNYIDQQTYDEASAQPATAKIHALPVEVEAPYVAEMVRSEMVDRYGDEAYTGGYRVYTTVTGKAQGAANDALRMALLSYERRHGYRGPEAKVELETEADEDVWQKALQEYSPVGGLKPALVVAVEEKNVSLYLGEGEPVVLGPKAYDWARKYISRNRRGPKIKTAADVFTVGDIVRLEAFEEGWRLAQLPDVSGAFVAMDPNSGAIQALAGGFDFFLSKFNRVTQARRQPGSGFKPMIYSAALEKGFSVASTVNDAPVVFDDPSLESAWRPENYSGKSFGPTRLRVALTKSRNLVSIRLLRQIGIDYAVEYAQRFGFKEGELGRDLSLSLGSSVVRPLDMARAYSVLANGGFKVEPHFILRVENGRGEEVYRAEPLIVCAECENSQPTEPEPTETPEVAESPVPAEGEAESVVVVKTPQYAPRIISAQNHYLMNSMMRDVVKRGTARKAMALKRNDLAGKTGTTNDQRDAWFNGFQRNLVGIAWVGFDSMEKLGRGETGGRAALPMWIDFMGAMLEGEPEAPLTEPEGMVRVRIDPKSGLLARAGQKDAVFESFREGNVPQRQAELDTPLALDGGDDAPDVTEELF